MYLYTQDKKKNAFDCGFSHGSGPPGTRTDDGDLRLVLSVLFWMLIQSTILKCPNPS